MKREDTTEEFWSFEVERGRVRVHIYDKPHVLAEMQEPTALDEPRVHVCAPFDPFDPRGTGPWGPLFGPQPMIHVHPGVDAVQEWHSKQGELHVFMSHATFHRLRDDAQFLHPAAKVNAVVRLHDPEREIRT